MSEAFARIEPVIEEIRAAVDKAEHEANAAAALSRADQPRSGSRLPLW